MNRERTGAATAAGLTGFFVLLMGAFLFLDTFFPYCTEYPFKWAWGKGSRNLLNGDITRRLDVHLVRMRSFVFGKTREPLAYRIYRLTGQTQSQALVGRNGWIFSEWTVKQDWQEGPNARTMGLQRLVRLRDWLKAYDVDLLIAVPPAKLRIYPENFGTGRLPDHLVRKYRDFCLDLDRLGLAHMDLERVLLEEKRKARLPTTLYFPGDHHWSHLGCMVASQHIAEHLRARYPTWCDRARGGISLEGPFLEPAPRCLYGQLNFPKDLHMPEFESSAMWWRVAEKVPFSDKERAESPFVLASDSFALLRLAHTMRDFLEYFLRAPVNDCSKLGGEYQGALLRWVENPANLTRRPRCFIYVIWEPQIINRSLSELDQLWERHPPP